MRTRQAAAMVSASVAISLATVTPMVLPSPVRAAASLVITNQGAALDNSGHVTSGWTSYLVSVQADPGELVAAIDMALTKNGQPYNGIFGNFLQDWHPTKAGASPTPVGDAVTDTNGADNGTDSHWLVSNIFVAAPLTEDSDGINPAGAPANDSGNIWGTGTYLTGALGFGGADQRNLQPLLYIVARTGTNSTISLDLAQRPVGGDVDPIVPHLTASLPEPMGTWSLFACATGSMLFRRRRPPAE